MPGLTVHLTEEEAAFIRKEFITKITSEKARIWAYKGLKNPEKIKECQEALRVLLNMQPKFLHPIS